MDNSLLEYYHNIGKIPDKYYYQMNGRSMAENFREQLVKRQQAARRVKQEKQEQEELNQRLEKLLEEKLEKALEDVLGNLKLN